MIRPIHLAALAMLCACGGASAGERQPESADSASRATDPAASADTVVRPDTAVSLDGYLLFDSAAADVDGDGADEHVYLGAVVGRDDEGRLEWDDGQQWVVAVRDGADTYPLLSEHVNWGGVAFWAFAGDSTRPPAILVNTTSYSTGHGATRLQKFVFDRSRGGYALTGSVEDWGHVQYRGPPDGLEPPSPFPPPDSP